MMPLPLTAKPEMMTKMTKNENKKSMVRSWLTFVGITFGIVLIIVLVGNTAQPFKYGTWQYYLTVDSQVRKFPIIGTERKNTLYQKTDEDGTQAAMLIVSYTSSMSSSNLAKAYQKACNKIGYHFKPGESSLQILNFNAKKPFNELSLELHPSKQGSEVKLIFIYEFAN
jgi:hypothetical protein